MILRRDIAKRLGPAAVITRGQSSDAYTEGPKPYYFSTQGCALGASGVCLSGLLDVPFAAAAFRALISKKLDMVALGKIKAEGEYYEEN